MLEQQAFRNAAAAATLLVVVPAKLLGAGSFAAPRINWRRKSPVIRRVDMGCVSNHHHVVKAPVAMQ